jgi:hypothetical protein
MAQTDYVPLVPSDRIRPSSRLSTPGHWSPERPAELSTLRPPTGPQLGATGPDLGFGMKLANRVAEDAVWAEGERRADVVAGCFACGTRRSSHFHRAPVIYDMQWAFTLWGFMPGAPEDLVRYRRPLFAGVDHDYARCRGLVDRVPDEVLPLSAAQVADRLATWDKWLGGGAR